MRPLRALSLGWGVQSFTLAAMSALGELPKLDVAISADSTWEHQATYAFAKHWSPWLEAHDIPVVTVNNAKQAARVVTDKTDIPAFTIDFKKDKDGMLGRHCTSRWKIHSIRWFIRAIRSGVQYDYATRFVIAWRYQVPLNDYLRLCERIQPFTQVEQWLGISLDEVIRAKDSDVKYIDNHCPLLDLNMTRAHCVTWLEAHGLPVPPKSSCVF